MKPPIINKHDMYLLYQSCQLGNRLRHWDTVEAYLQDTFEGIVGLRYKLPGSPWMTAGLGRDTLPMTVSQWIANGCDPKLLTVSEVAPHHIQTINAEVCTSTRHVELTYSMVRKPMRQAFAESTEYDHGLSALLRLKHWLDESSMDNVNRLLSDYPDHVMELSAFEQAVGVFLWNTVIWEVRRY